MWTARIRRGRTARWWCWRQARHLRARSTCCRNTVPRWTCARVRAHLRHGDSCCLGARSCWRVLRACAAPLAPVLAGRLPCGRCTAGRVSVCMRQACAVPTGQCGISGCKAVPASGVLRLSRGPLSYVMMHKLKCCMRSARMLFHERTSVHWAMPACRPGAWQPPPGTRAVPDQCQEGTWAAGACEPQYR